MRRDATTLAAAASASTMDLTTDHTGWTVGRVECLSLNFILRFQFFVRFTLDFKFFVQHSQHKS